MQIFVYLPSFDRTLKCFKISKKIRLNNDILCFPVPLLFSYCDRFSRSQTQSISHMSGQWQPQHFQIAPPLSRAGSSLSTVHIVDAINSSNGEQDGVGVYVDSTGRGSPSIDIIYSCDSRDRNNCDTTRRVGGNQHEPTASF